jgi:hypothetical protein
MTCYRTPECFVLSNSRICRLRLRPALRFERPSHWGGVLFHIGGLLAAETGRQLRSVVLVEPRSGYKGFYICCELLSGAGAFTRQNHMRDVIPDDGSQPEAKKKRVRQMQRSPKELHAK